MARVETADVVVAPDEPGTTTVLLRNVSELVDGLVIHPVDPLPWLVVTHEEAHLLPGESRTVVVTFATRPGILAVAQRLVLDLVVRSCVDATKATPVQVALTVPRAGPPPTLTARPALLQLADADEGVVTLSFDNRSANFPRHYRLAVHDPQDVVRARFVPPQVDVPPGESVDVSVRVTAPAATPGSEVTRQLTLTGVADEGQVSTSVTLVQRTAAPPPHVPVVLRMEPGRLRSENGKAVRFELVVDNRAGREAAAVTLEGRDPAHQVTLSFVESRLVVPAGRAARVPGRARTPAPPPGTTRSHPFVVVANDGTADVEVPGVLEAVARPAPIGTARLWVEPQTLVTQRRHGAYLVHVDNRRGRDPLQVQLSGADELGTARLAFTPAVIVVPGGQVGTVRVAVDSATPPAGTSSSRRLRISASDGREAVETEAVLSQSTPDRRPVAKRWLVVLGAVLAGLGALLPWLGRMVDPQAIVWVASSAFEGDREAIAFTATVGSTVLVLVLALLMLIGLNGSNGRGIRFAALLMVLVALTAGILGTPGGGLALVLLGAVLGFVGGVLARSRPPGGR
ncbi:hypothetical protein [Cellulomonas xiejunii]|uniref:hypothetical protein n=1 Tax=Cellulomonas xiejunii TaxID=2968083 RepID=UPI001D0EF5C2|nr:hypothetical protein [Cellulomonas xiejunii]MCC2316273.1 hypothetical protein [Cellulomonas xiejunii]